MAGKQHDGKWTERGVEAIRAERAHPRNWKIPQDSTVCVRSEIPRYGSRPRLVHWKLGRQSPTSKCETVAVMRYCG